MECEITISEITGNRRVDGSLESILVTGLAKNCDSVKVSIFCIKDSLESPNIVEVIYSEEELGYWETTFTLNENDGCNCGYTTRIDAFCENNPECKTTESLVLFCPNDNDLNCPEDIGLQIIDNQGNNITESVQHQGYHSLGSYDFQIIVYPPDLDDYNLSFQIRVDGELILLTSEHGVTNIAPDNNSFSFEFLENSGVVQVTAIIQKEGCSPIFNTIELREFICPDGQVYTDGECNCPDRKIYVDGECICPDGLILDPETGLCIESDDEDEEDEPGNGNGRKPKLCKCGKWWCYPLMVVLVALIAAYIVGAFNCFVNNVSELPERILEAGRGIINLVSLVDSLGIGTAIIAFWRICGVCCTACALWGGIAAGIAAVIFQSIWQGQFPPCAWNTGIWVLVGLIIIAMIYTKLCNDN